MSNGEDQGDLIGTAPPPGADTDPPGAEPSIGFGDDEDDAGDNGGDSGGSSEPPSETTGERDDGRLGFGGQEEVTVSGPDGETETVDIEDEGDTTIRGRTTTTTQTTRQGLDERQDTAAQRIQGLESQVVEQIRSVEQQRREATTSQERRRLSDLKDRLQARREEIAEAETAARLGGAGVIRGEDESLGAARGRAAERTIERFEDVVSGDDAEARRRAERLREFTQRRLPERQRKQEERTSITPQERVARQSLRAGQTRVPEPEQPGLQPGEQRRGDQQLFTGGSIPFFTPGVEAVRAAGALTQPSATATLGRFERVREQGVTDSSLNPFGAFTTGFEERTRGRFEQEDLPVFLEESLREDEAILSSFLGDVRTLTSPQRQGRPVQTTAGDLIQDFTAAESTLGGENPIRSTIGGVTETARDITDVSANVDQILFGESSFTRRARPLDLERRPAQGLTRLAAEELAFEGPIRGAAALSDAQRARRAARQIDSISPTTGPADDLPVFEADEVVGASPDQPGQARITGGERVQGIGAPDVVDPDDVLETVIGRQTSEGVEASPLSPDSPLGQQVAEAADEGVAEDVVALQRRRGTAPETDPGEDQLARAFEELSAQAQQQQPLTPGEQVRGPGVSEQRTRELLGRVQRQVREASEEAGAQRLLGDERRLLLGDEQVTETTVFVRDTSTGRIRQVPETQALDLLQDDQFEIVTRRLSPRERERVLQARRQREQRGLPSLGDEELFGGTELLPEDLGPGIPRQQVGFEEPETRQTTLQDRFDVFRDEQTGTTLTRISDEPQPAETTGFLEDLTGGMDRRGQFQLRFFDEAGDTADTPRFFDEVVDEQTRRLERSFFPEADAPTTSSVDDFGIDPFQPQSTPFESTLAGGEAFSFEPLGADEDLGGPLLDIGLRRETQADVGLDQPLLEQPLIGQERDTSVDVFQEQEELTRPLLRQDQETQLRQEEDQRTRRPGLRRGRGDDFIQRGRDDTGRPPFLSFDLPGSQRRQDGFEGVVRREGELRSVGEFDSFDEASSAAQRVVEESPAMTFGVRRGDDLVDVEPPRGWRESQRDNRLVVEPRRDAIDSSEEREEITRTGLRALEQRRENRRLLFGDEQRTGREDDTDPLRFF